MAVAERPAPMHAPEWASEPPHRPESGTPWYASGWLATLLGVLVVVALSPAVALAFYQYHHVGVVYEGVSVFGVDVSGLTRADVEKIVTARAAELTGREVLVRAEDNQWRTDWGRLGVQLPVQPVVDQVMAVGRQGTPLDRLYAQARALRTGRAIAVRETLDERAIVAFVDTAAAQIDRPLRNARLDLMPDLTLELTSAQAGRRLDRDESIRLLREAADVGAPSVTLPVATLAPQTTDDMRLAAKAKAEKILAGPLSLTYAERSWTVERQEIAELLVFSGGPGVPIDVRLDADKLRPRIEAIAKDVTQEPRDARIEWADGGVRATSPSQEGRKLDADGTLKLVVSQLESGARTVALPVEVARPRIDSTRLADLGIRELIDSATTSFAGSVPQKQHNVRLAASRLNNAVIPPGEKFSFNKALGPTTLDNGYQMAFGITSDGGTTHRTVPSVAGGICQVATTLFQPMFWSGYQLEERHWHLYWIPAYSSKGVVGLDATVDEEVGLDLQFVNNTDTFLLIQSSTDDSSVTFKLFGTKPNWQVKTEGPTITDRRPADPTPVVEREPSLPEGARYAVEAAREGFTASFVRNVTTPDGKVRTLRLESKYEPSRNVTLVGTGGRR